MFVESNTRTAELARGGRGMAPAGTIGRGGSAGSGVRAERRPEPQWHPRWESGLRETGIAFLWAFMISLPVLGAGGWFIYGSWREREDARLAGIEEGFAYERLVAAAPGDTVAMAEAVHGRELFGTVCAVCHGPDGRGVDGLGKNLAESDFVARCSDDAMRQFLVLGRPAARPVAMPPKGGRPDLTDADLRDVVAYVRGLQDPRRMPDLPAVVVAPPSAEQKAAALSAAGGDAELAAYIANGDKLFHSTCIACHGKGGAGVAGNGKALVKNPFVQSLDDDGLLAFVKQGRTPTDPKNTTGIQMPPKGGNPALSDDDLLDIIAYLRTLQGEKPAAAGAPK